MTVDTCRCGHPRAEHANRKGYSAELDPCGQCGCVYFATQHDHSVMSRERRARRDRFLRALPFIKEVSLGAGSCEWTGWRGKTTCRVPARWRITPLKSSVLGRANYCTVHLYVFTESEEREMRRMDRWWDKLGAGRW